MIGWLWVKLIFNERKKGYKLLIIESSYFDHCDTFIYSAESLQWHRCGGAFLDKKVIGSGLYLYTNSLVIFDYSKCFKMQVCLPTFTITHRRQWLHQDCHWECGFPVQSGTVLQEAIRGSDFCSRTLFHVAGDRTTAYCSERWSWYRQISQSCFFMQLVPVRCMNVSLAADVRWKWPRITQ